MYAQSNVKHIIAHTFSITDWLTHINSASAVAEGRCLQYCLAWLIYSDSFYCNPHRKHIMYCRFFFFFPSDPFCFASDIFIHTEVPDKSLLGIWMLSLRLSLQSQWDWQQCLLRAATLFSPCSYRTKQECLEYCLYDWVTDMNIRFDFYNICEVSNCMWPSRNIIVVSYERVDSEHQDFRNLTRFLL